MFIFPANPTTATRIGRTIRLEHPAMDGFVEIQVDNPTHLPHAQVSKYRTGMERTAGKLANHFIEALQVQLGANRECVEVLLDYWDGLAYGDDCNLPVGKMFNG